METNNFVNPSELKIYQSDKASVDSQVATAKEYPRDLEVCIRNIKAIILSDKEVAEDCIYTLPRGGKKLQGPSVYLARILAQELGNMRIQCRVVGISEKHITAEGICWDLEKNLASQTAVQRSIVGSNGRFDDSLITVTGNAANSIAMRNAILNVINVAIVEMAMKTARKAITGDVSTEEKLMLKVKSVFEGLASTYKVTEPEILLYLNRASIKHVTAEDIVTLIGVGTAIKDNTVSVDEIFRPAKFKPTPVDTDKKESERLIGLMRNAKTPDDLKKFEKNIKHNDERLIYDECYKKLQEGKGKS